MTTYIVSPLPDSVDQRYGWQVQTANGRRVSTHTVKSAAKRAARRKASSSDEVRLQRTDGTFM